MLTLEQRSTRRRSVDLAADIEGDGQTAEEYRHENHRHPVRGGVLALKNRVPQPARIRYLKVDTVQSNVNADDVKCEHIDDFR